MSGQIMKVLIRAARFEDIGDIAELVYLAGKSHMETSIYDLMFPGSRDYQVEVLRELLNVTHWFNYSLFLVAVVDGRVASTLCGYSACDTGMPRLKDALAPRLAGAPMRHRY